MQLHLNLFSKTNFVFNLQDLSDVISNFSFNHFSAIHVWGLEVDLLLPAFLFTCLYDQLKSNDKFFNTDHLNSFTFISLSIIRC